MKKTLLILFIIFSSFSLLPAQFQFAGKVTDLRKYDNRVELTLENAKVNIYVYDNNVIRFRYTNKKEFSRAPSYAVIYGLPHKTNFGFSDDKTDIKITTDELIVKITKSPCRIVIYDKEMNLINSDDESFGVSFDNDEVRCFKKLLDGESFYGLGEKTGNLRKNGNEYTLWNTDFPAYNNKTDALYQSIPFFYGIRNLKAYGIFFDNPYKSRFNFGASNNRFYWFGAEQGEMDYYFINGSEIKKVLSSYTQLTGRMELPPMWALGYQQSRWSYYPESALNSITNSFRSKKIPCDVLYLDIHYMDGYRVFTWDKKRFPDPPKMLADLKTNGFKVVTIIDPGVKADTNYFAAKEGVKQNLFAKYPDGTLYQGEVWPSWAYFPDFTKKETRNWWGDKLSVLMKEGIEGFWNDMNEPATWGQSFPDLVQFDDNGFKASHKKIHNVFGLEMAQATREGLKKYSDKRHFILTRAGYSGIQRYSAIWTGDNVSNEEHLSLACTMSLNMGLGGLPFVGADVGGFIDDASARLYLRWIELGAFTPFFRQHSAYGTKAKEPWAFGEDIEYAVRNMINLRYRLLPFFYNEFYTASKTGLPIMRPMFLNYQNDKECYSNQADYQFMIGDNLLLAPVLTEKTDFKKLYLPEGNWHYMPSNKFYAGGQWIILEVPLNTIPMFLKEGGIIPIQEVQQYVGEKNIEETEFHIYPSKKSSYTLYEDDGISYGYEKGKYSLTNVICEKKDNSIIVSVKKEFDGYKNSRKYYLLTILTDTKPVSVSSGVFQLSESASIADLKKRSNCFFYDESGKFLFIRVEDKENLQINVSLK
jgi:alpha-glucosidase